MEEQFKKILEELSVTDDILEDTPARACRAYGELLDGYHRDPVDVANAFYQSDMDEMIILRNIPFESFCEHHMVPIIGKATVGYIPNGKIIGASKLARLVDCFAHRLQLQERFTMQIALALESVLESNGVAVYIIGEHFCISKRGVKKSGAEFVTRFFTGDFKKNFDLRREFLDSLNVF